MIESEWTLDEELKTLKELSQEIISRGLKERVRLLITPQDLIISDDEILVQSVDPNTRTMVITPKRIVDINSSDVLFEASVIDPTDTAYTEHAEEMRAAKCLYRYPDGKTHVGIYE